MGVLPIIFYAVASVGGSAFVCDALSQEVERRLSEEGEVWQEGVADLERCVERGPTREARLSSTMALMEVRWKTAQGENVQVRAARVLQECGEKSSEIPACREATDRIRRVLREAAGYARKFKKRSDWDLTIELASVLARLEANEEASDDATALQAELLFGSGHWGLARGAAGAASRSRFAGPSKRGDRVLLDLAWELALGHIRPVSREKGCILRSPPPVCAGRERASTDDERAFVESANAFLERYREFIDRAEVDEIRGRIANLALDRCDVAEAAVVLSMIDDDEAGDRDRAETEYLRRRLRELSGE